MSNDKPQKRGPAASSQQARSSRPARRLPWWKKALFALIACTLFFTALEILLAVCGLEVTLYQEDPYVGFSSHVPLFVERPSADGGTEWATADNKRDFFCLQRFSKKKEHPKTYRIFCMGGSTTYGRPYDDRTSFCRWLRELLPVADPSRRWEVINAGGISYASYRVALLMEELINYEPDLFVIYSGHNEFLERRTYGRLIRTPAPVRGLGALASRTRTWAALKQLIERVSPAPNLGGQTAQLPEEVAAVLTRSIGPSAYRRDDELRGQVLAHYRFSLSRMVDIASSVGAAVILITPASNLRDCSPFKSENSSTLTATERQRWKELFERARKAEEMNRLDDGLKALEEAAMIDDRHAGLHFLRGRLLARLERHDESRAAFQRARDEDVCPLRALTPMGAVVKEVASQRDVPLVDFAALVESRSQHGLPGKDLFLDHVHPTIETHRELALAIIDSMTAEGLLQPNADWRDDRDRQAAVDRVTQDVESGVDRRAHGAAQIKLAMVMSWAGKFEDGYRAAKRAVELVPQNIAAHYHLARCAQILDRAEEAAQHYRRVLELEFDPTYSARAENNLGVILERQGKLTEAQERYANAVRLKPDFAEAHYNLGVAYNKQRRFAQAEGEFHSALLLQPDFPRACFNLGLALESQGKFAEAAVQYREALRVRPGYARAESRLRAMLTKQGKR